MPTLPNWLTGPALTAVTLTPLLRASNGVLSETTPVQSVRGVCRRIRLENDPQHEDIRPVASTLVHNVITGEDNTIVLSLIKTRTGLGALTQLVTQTNYIKATFTQGGEQWTGYFTRGRFTTGVESHGANEEELTLRQIEVNEVNGSVTVAAV